MAAKRSPGFGCKKESLRAVKVSGLFYHKERVFFVMIKKENQR